MKGYSMLNMKRSLFVLALCNALPFSTISATRRYEYNNNSSNADGALVALGVAAAAVAIVGAGAYKWYEWSSYDSDIRTVQDSQQKLNDLNKKYLYVDAAEQVVDTYKNNTARFENLVADVSSDVHSVQSTTKSMREIQRYWATTAYASGLVRDARELQSVSTNLYEGVSLREKALRQIRPIVHLENMLMNEHKAAIYPMIYARNSDEFEGVLTAIYEHSEWPFLQAHHDIGARKNGYEGHISAYSQDYHHQFAPTIEQANGAIIAYEQAQARIVRNARYTEDKRYKREQDRKDELERLERIKAQAAREQAEAAQRQARAAERTARANEQQAAATAQANIDNLKARLHSLHSELSATETALSRASSWAESNRLHENHNRIRREISDVKTSLYGHPLLLRIFVEFFPGY